jgi:hypothetical protein
VRVAVYEIRHHTRVVFWLFESRNVGAFIEELDTATFHIMLKRYNLAIRRDKVIRCALRP